MGFLLSHCRRQNTFSGWAFQIGLLSGTSVSKQGLFDRINCKATAFAKQLVEQVLLERTAQSCNRKIFSNFGKVLLQDSTTLRLPPLLNKIFPGNYSLGRATAVARIQSIIDLKAMRFIDFVLGSFTQNDQSASGSILSHVKKGDLVIRDLGYFSLPTFGELIKAETHFLSRLKYGTSIFDKQGKPISLKKFFRRGRPMDAWVLVGVKHKLPVRLVMMPLPKGQAAERIRRAKGDRDKRLNHSKAYYKWLGYSVYITSVDKSVWTAKDVVKAYQVRWQIEIIFKSWKTCFHLQEMIQDGGQNEHRVKVSIYLMLLFICLFMKKIYVRYQNELDRMMGRQISLLKLAAFVINHLIEIFSLSTQGLKQLIAQQCCYENRDDRVNLASLGLNFKELP